MHLPISPILFLAIMAAITASALLAHRLLRLRMRTVLSRLARELQMHYAETDHFDIARRITADFPVPGAADLRVLDLIYASDDRQYCYIFTAQYTRGVIARHARESRVMSFCESKDHPQQNIELKCAPSRGSLREQYRQLKSENVTRIA